MYDLYKCKDRGTIMQIQFKKFSDEILKDIIGEKDFGC